MIPRWLPWLAVLLPGGGIVVLGMAIYRRWRSPAGMSPQWLRQQDQRASRINFDGVKWRFPV